MTSYPPQPPVRKLTRSRSNKMLGGVCAGVAAYLNMDVTLVRVLTVALSLFTGVPIIAYIVCLIVVPEEDVPPYVGPETVHVPESATYPGPTPTAPTGPTAPAGPAASAPNAPTDPVWGSDGAPWEQPGSPAAESGPTPTAEPGPAAPDPEIPNEAAPVADSEDIGETPAPHAAPGQESSWESAPADPEQTEEDHTEETGPEPADGKDKPAV